MKRHALISQHFKVLLALTCLSLGGLGMLEVLMQWGPPLDIQIVIVPDSALALGLFGLALLSGLRGALAWSRGWASALLAMGIYGVAHNLIAGGSQPVISLLTGHPVTGTGMAAIFMLQALSLLLSGEPGRWARRLSLILRRLLVLIGAALLLVGWLPDLALPDAFEHPFIHPHAGSIASLFVLASGLAVPLPWHASPSRDSMPAHLALMAGLVGALLSTGGWLLFSQQKLESLAEKSHLVLAQVQSSAEHSLEDHVQLIQRQANRWEALGQLPSPALWRQESRSYLDDFPALDLLGVFDHDFQPVRLAIRPTQSREWLAKLLAPSPSRGRLSLALDGDGQRLSPVMMNPDGDPIVMLALPLATVDGDHWLIASLNVETLLHREIVQDTDKFNVHIHEGAQRLFSSRPATDPSELFTAGEQLIDLPFERRWRLSSHLDVRTLKLSSVLPTLLLISGLAFTLLLMTSLGLHRVGERHRQRLKDNQHTLREALQERDQFFTLSLELFCRVDLEGRFLQINPAIERLLGYPADRLVGGHYSALVREEDHPAIDTAITQLGNGQPIRELEARVRDASGREHWVEINAALGEERVIYVVARDITNRKRAESQLRILERSVESSVNGVVIVDAKQRDLPIVYVNPAFEHITGYSRQEAIGRNCRFLQGENTEPRDRKALREGIALKRDLHVVVRNYRRDGSTFWNDLYISPVSDETGEVTHFIGVQNDISTQREYQSQLAYNTNHDALTGLPNRSLLEERLRQDCQIASRYRRHLAVLFVDLDGFKPINDTLGHGIGDRILVEVARRLEQQLRHVDTVARFGGDEFVVVLPDLAREGDVMPVVERLLASLSTPYLADGNELHITASIGIAFSDGDVEHSMQLIQQATLAMYRAKRQGRNTSHWYTHDLKQRVSERVSMRNALQRAIEEQQFELHYQPQIHGPSGQIIGVEALVRWHHPEQGFISPADFIGLAEETGQIVPISDWVLATACRDGKRLNTLGLGRFITAVNVSPMQFRRVGFVAGVLQTLETAQLDADLLELELTEGILMESSETAIDILQELRAHGITIAIDDFGTGYSSLSYLKYLPINKIKIDRTFVKEVISDQRDAAIIQGVAAMATRLQLKVVAEGVETQAQYAYLSKQLCDTFQGYYFARPMPLEDLITFLGEHHQARSLEQARRDGEQGRQTLLLLDDEANILRALKRVLRRDGYHILTADTARQAFEMLATEEVEVIISDQRMPEMSGTEFLHRAKDLYPETIQIVLSGYTDLKTVTEAINEGAIYKFLTKPWDDDELRLVVQQAFRKAALQRVKRHHQRDH
ncbi:EAL domain-containing protein [Halomonas kalidii]|uniref:EAL domain-containing protein n=1 Tax=Halomonas kalidii TaxID=3043293 RepID=A0ABT6VME8_9GAMM|nr:EAL domain-containing protein [Halomonas kalidii]MDI5935161.1 EAL domain-containing protein [Halomonas kalidii]